MSTTRPSGVAQEIYALQITYQALRIAAGLDHQLCLARSADAATALLPHR